MPEEAIQMTLEKKEKKKHTSLYIPPSELMRLKRLKKASGHSSSELIRMFIRQGLDRELGVRT
jgi:hypothetical protein